MSIFSIYNRKRKPEGGGDSQEVPTFALLNVKMRAGHDRTRTRHRLTRKQGEREDEKHSNSIPNHVSASKVKEKTNEHRNLI